MVNSGNKEGFIDSGGDKDISLQNLHFDIHPSVIFQLGDQLVSDDVTAVLELVKNAYDADADWVNIRVEPNYEGFSEDESVIRGRITIEDNGMGMGLAEIRHGWLTVSNSLKKSLKQTGGVTPQKGRTPQGDKGLGRLGVQRLGRFCVLETSRRLDIEGDVRGQGYYIGIDWEKFRKTETLTEVSFVRREIEPRQGTKITITGLTHLENWSNRTVFEDVRRRLSQLIFPFSTEKLFEVYGEINGWKLDLSEFAERQMEQATLRYWLTFQDGVLGLWGRYRLNYLSRGNSKNDGRDFERLIKPDNGANFFSYLGTKRANQDLGITYIGDHGWFLSVHMLIPLNSIKPSLVEGKPANPGEFSGQIAEFILRDASDDIMSVFDSRGEYTEFVKRHAGVRVFRDGFGIRPYGLEGEDWLKLSSQQTTGRSFYGLRPANTVGFILLTGQANTNLGEKTDREGFVDSPYTANFFGLMDAVVQRIHRVNDVIRRGYNEFKNAQARQEVSITSDSGLEDLQKRVQSVVSSAETLQQEVVTSRHYLTEVAQKATSTARELSHVAPKGSEFPNIRISRTIEHAERVIRETEGALGQAQHLMDKIDNQLTEVIIIEKTVHAVQAEYELLREQLEQYTSLAALGMSAEAISHEMFNVLDRLGDQTRTMVTMAKMDIHNRRLFEYLSYVRTSVSALRKQVSRLDPGLQNVRDQRDTVWLGKYLEDSVSNYYFSRMLPKSIVVLWQTKSDFKIRMNLGKLNQVLDNITYNAEYWLTVEIRQNPTLKAEINFVVDAPYLTIWDTGIGVDPTIENSIFEPFVTGKPRREGRGLGLFIVRQLLDSYGCIISLLPDRNLDGRRYKFQIDLSEVCVNESQ